MTDVRRCGARACRGPDGQPRQIDTGTICTPCAELTAKLLPTLPYRYYALSLSLAPGSNNTERVSGLGFRSNSPIRDAVLSAMDELAWWHRNAETLVREALGMPKIAYTHTRPAYVVAKANQTLVRQWDRTTTHDIAPAIVHATRYWRTRADRLLGWDRLRHRLPAPCPYCDTLTLVRDNGDSNVHCTGCQRQWIEAEYQHLVRVLADDLKRGA